MASFHDPSTVETMALRMRRLRGEPTDTPLTDEEKAAALKVLMETAELLARHAKPGL